MCFACPHPIENILDYNTEIRRPESNLCPDGVYLVAVYKRRDPVPEEPRLPALSREHVLICEGCVDCV